MQPAPGRPGQPGSVPGPHRHDRLPHARYHRCRIATAGHLPPVRTRPSRPPALLDLPTGAPLGVGGVAFHDTPIDLAIGDEPVLGRRTADVPVDGRRVVVSVGLRRPVCPRTSDRDTHTDDSFTRAAAECTTGRTSGTAQPGRS
ncbi:SpoIIE family protein phosphatase [Saccharothrix sp. ST-888]|uniref:SpoIIE family protein phosphatase n=1 Tax=Saccharothrix sp. ST-888 TaxID=1427391 RepID=UPI0018CD3AF4